MSATLCSVPAVCKSVGNVDRAYRIFQDVKLLPGNSGKPDAYVYCMLIATCAEAMKRDLEVALERKEQFVLLERAFQYVAEAEAAHVPLEVPVWNALLLCAGRCAELNRAFEVLEMMQARGVSANVITYGSLIEACVLCRQPDKARRVFEVALSKVRLAKGWDVGSGALANAGQHVLPLSAGERGCAWVTVTWQETSCLCLSSIVHRSTPHAQGDAAGLMTNMSLP